MTRTLSPPVALGGVAEIDGVHFRDKIEKENEVEAQSSWLLGLGGLHHPQDQEKGYLSTFPETECSVLNGQRNEAA